MSTKNPFYVLYQFFRISGRYYSAAGEI